MTHPPLFAPVFYIHQEDHYLSCDSLILWKDQYQSISNNFKELTQMIRKWVWWRYLLTTVSIWRAMQIFVKRTRKKKKKENRNWIKVARKQCFNWCVIFIKWFRWNNTFLLSQQRTKKKQSIIAGKNHIANKMLFSKRELEWSHVGIRQCLAHMTRTINRNRCACIGRSQCRAHE